jgi:pimeloyl-ACP methyl ester carboxylesterase
LRSVGAAVRASGLLSPALADGWSAQLFSTPRGRSHAQPRTESLISHRFDLWVQGTRIAAWDWGRGPTVLLSHGWQGSAAQFSAFVEPLVEAGFYVVAFDQPAHGSSTGEQATIVDMAATVKALAHRVGPVHTIIGHSLGGTAAALALARGARAERLLMLGSPAEPSYFARRMATQLGLGPARTQGLLAELERRVGPFESVSIPRLAPAQRAKLLVLHDPTDREVPFEHGRAIAEAWPGARLVPLAGVGHRRMLRERDVIRRAVQFVAGSDEALVRSA